MKKAEDRVDLMDTPEALDWSDARRGVFYGPVKKQLTLRIDAEIVAWFKSQATKTRGCQTHMNLALRDHVRRMARSRKAN